MSSLILHIVDPGATDFIPLKSRQSLVKEESACVFKQQLIAGENVFGKVICDQYSNSGIIYHSIRCDVNQPADLVITTGGKYLLLLYACSGYFVSHQYGQSGELIAQTQGRTFFPETDLIRITAKPDGKSQPILYMTALPLQSKIISSLSGLYDESEILNIISQQRGALNSSIDFQKIIFDLYREFENPDPSQISIQAMTTILLLKMIRAANNQMQEDLSGGNYDPDKRIAYNMAESIILGLDERLTLKNIAKAQHLSPNKLKILFKKHMGIPAAAFRISVRMQKARQLLMETELSIQEISAMVGYSNPTQFSSMFKKKMGFTPNQLRK